MNTQARTGTGFTALVAVALLAAAAAAAAEENPDARRAMIPVVVTDPSPVLISAPPEYPAMPRRLGMDGAVQLRMLVGSDGLPRNLSITGSSGYRVLDQAALRTAGDFRFRPAQVDGEAVETWASIPLSFRLEGRRQRGRVDGAAGVTLVAGN